jgi:hypothetical protein
VGFFFFKNQNPREGIETSRMRRELAENLAKKSP